MRPNFNIYNKLSKMRMEDVALNEDGTPVDLNVETFYSNPEHPAHISGLDTNYYYKCNGKRMMFGCTSLAEYGVFLKHLSIISGFKSTDELNKCSSPAYFKELTNFSMEEGVIGPIIANKLFNDFKDNYNIASCYFEYCPEGDKLWIHYQNWCAGLYIAKEHGAIMIT